MSDHRIHVPSPSGGRWNSVPLSEARKIVRALQQGEVDAFVVAHSDAERVFLLEDPEAVKHARELRRTREALEQTQSEYQSLFQLAGVGMVQIELATARFLRVNRRMCEITGYCEDELLGKTVFEITHPDDCEAGRESFQRLSAGSMSEHTSERRLIHKDGSVLWVAMNAVALRDESGGASRAVGIVQDITDRKKAEAALVDMLDRLSIAQRAADSGMWDHDCRTGSTTWTDEYRDLYGHGPEVVPSFEAWKASVHPDDRERVERELHEQLQARRERCIMEFRRIHPQRGLRWLRSISRVVYDADGPIRITGLTQDVTEAHRLEEELRRSNEELQHFASVVAHDLRSPLQSISGCVELLSAARDELSEENRQLIGYMAESVAGMRQLISSLLAFTRAGFTRIACSACDMKVVLSRALQNVRSQVDQSQATITAGELPSVTGDGVMLAQLLQNLFENAIKYRSHAPPVIHVSAQCEGSFCHFTVRDNGVGIEPSQLEHIFQPFHRIAGQQATERGVGLGLATCRQIVERHGGRIWAESTPGQGTTIHFTLPAPTPADRPPPIVT